MPAMVSSLMERARWTAHSSFCFTGVPREKLMARRDHDLLAAIDRAARQEQFLEVVSAEEVRARCG
jgi:hypothetical protein